MSHSGTRPRSWTLAIASLAVIILVAGCGSSSKKTSSASPSTGAASSTPSSTASNAPPIKIGFICSCSGALASSTAINLPGYRAWVKSVNASGGINGHQVQLIVKDDALNPSTSIAAVHELIEQDHVIALANISNVEAGWSAYVAQQKIPVIGTSLSSTNIFTQPNWFPQGQTNQSLPAAVVLAAKKVGAKSFGIVYCAEAPACQQLIGPEQQAAQTYGVPLAYKTAVSASAPNYTAQCLAAKQSGAEALFIADAVSVVESVAKDCAQQGYKPAMIVDDGAIALAFKNSPGLSDGMIGIMPVIPFAGADSPGIQKMTTAFKTYEPSLLSDPNYNDEAVEGWTAGLLFEAAAKAGKLGANGTPTSDEIFNGLYALHDETLGGMTAPLNFKQGQPNPMSCWFWMRTKNGQFTTPYGLTPECLSSTP
jgi:branched-chain amino acid transport system substrate-binding protein